MLPENLPLICQSCNSIRVLILENYRMKIFLEFKTIKRYGKEFKDIKNNKTEISTNIADGWGETSGWQIRDLGMGFLASWLYS